MKHCLSYTLNPLSTGMGDCLWMGEPIGM